MKRDIQITYRGRDMDGVPIAAASATEGWIDVVETARRYPGGLNALLNRQRTDFVYHRLYGSVTITFKGRCLDDINFNRRGGR